MCLKRIKYIMKSVNNIINDNLNKETVVFGEGCFWCTEAVFKMLKGIISVEPGYAGGSKENPTYGEVCSGATGHAEVIKIEYDPRIISFNTLLTVFFATHDPTTINKQGRDVGEQYRSIVLHTTEEQKHQTKKFIEELNLSSKEVLDSCTKLGISVKTHSSTVTQDQVQKIKNFIEAINKIDELIAKLDMAGMRVAE